MARGRRGKARTRGRPCRACGGDAWLYRRDKRKWYCATCSRRAAAARGTRRRPTRILYENAQRRAREAGAAFRITEADVAAAWPADGRCPALGIELKRGAWKRANDASPSLDRINPAWGYEPGNVAVISMAANRVKNSARAQDLEKIAAWMRRQGLD